jgi:hypothetical protein
MTSSEPTLALRKEDLLWQVVEGDIVAFDFPSGVYFATNRTGALLWERLRTGATRSELVQAICDRYKITPEQARSAVDDFVSQLSARGFLE